MNESQADAKEEALPGIWERLVSTRSPVLPTLVILCNLVIIVLVNQYVLRDFPNSADEYSYLISAKLFADGRLNVPSPPLAHFFNFIHVVNDGQFYGKYPPGWPFLLSGGVFVGAPWLPNLFFGIATLVALYLGARSLFSLEVANISMLLTLGNPFLTFNAASYFSHTTCLFFVAGFLGFSIHWLKNPQSKIGPLFAGISIGMAFTIRPYTALVLAVPTLVYVILQARKSCPRNTLLVRLALGIAPAAGFVALFLLYNYLETGNPWLTPFNRYDLTDAPKATMGIDRIPWRIEHHIISRILTISLWLPLAPIFVLLCLVRRATRSKPHAVLMCILPIILMAAHFFYRGTGGNQYGPRYLFESSICLLVVGAIVTHSFKKAGLLMVLGVLVLNVSTFHSAAVFHSEQVNERMEVYDLVEKENIENAIVFLRTGSGTMPIGDLTRNGIYFDGSVLYVRDFGGENRDLLARYPDREGYVYEYDKRTKTGRLWALERRE